MSATPAREISKVESYTNPEGKARCKVTLADGDVVALHSLSRVELLKAARLAFPAIGHRTFMKLGNDVIRDAIRTGVAPSTEDAPAPAPKAETPPETPTPAPEAPVKAEAPKGQDPKLKALQEALEALAPSVSPDEVREMVSAEVKAALVDAQVVRVEVKSPKATNELPRTHHKALPELVQVLGAGCNVFLVGPAGSGKSTLAEQAFSALGLSTEATSFGPTTPTSKVFGYQDAQGRYVGTPFQRAYTEGQGILLDEMDNGHPGLMAETNQAIANGYAAFANGMADQHPDNRIVATGNTFGRGPDRVYVGRNILDAATLDRFVTIEIDYDEKLERSIALGYAEDGDQEMRSTIASYVDRVQAVRKGVFKAKLPLVVSPRASIDGAKLIRQGLSPDRVAEIRLYAGWSDEHKAKAGV